MLNVSIFAWYGSVCPWYSFAHNDVIPIYRLIFLGVLVLLLRRLPMILLFHKKIHQIEDIRQALFTGFFGPIGVSAVFYLYTSLDFLRTVEVDGHKREDAEQLEEVMLVVVWFMAICSIIVHGLTIPLGKLGWHIPRTISRAISSEPQSTDKADDEPVPLHLRQHAMSEEGKIEGGLARLRGRSRHRRDGADSAAPKISKPVRLSKLGGTVIKDPTKSRDVSKGRNAEKRLSTDENPATDTQASAPQLGSAKTGSEGVTNLPVNANSGRAVKFPDQDSRTE